MYKLLLRALNGTHPVTLVGDDAHIVPKSHGTTRSVEWNREMVYLCDIFPFNRPWKKYDPVLAAPFGGSAAKRQRGCR